MLGRDRGAQHGGPGRDPAGVRPARTHPAEQPPGQRARPLDQRISVVLEDLTAPDTSSLVTERDIQGAAHAVSQVPVVELRHGTERYARRRAAAPRTAEAPLSLEVGAARPDGRS